MTKYVIVDENEVGCASTYYPPQGDVGVTLQEAAKYPNDWLWGSRSYLVAVEDGVIRRLTAEEDAELRELCASSPFEARIAS